MALRVLDGGNLEDVMRALSNLASHHPRLFLETVQENDWEPSRIEALVRMLPLTVVDQPSERLRLVRQKLDAIQRVDVPRLARVRRITVEALEKYENQLR